MTEQQRWAEYERRKREWLASHLQHTSREYEQAIRMIAKDLGL